MGMKMAALSLSVRCSTSWLIRFLALSQGTVALTPRMTQSSAILLTDWLMVGVVHDEDIPVVSGASSSRSGSSHAAVLDMTMKCHGLISKQSKLIALDRRHKYCKGHSYGDPNHL